MAIVNLQATNRGIPVVPVPGLGGVTVCRSGTVELGAADSATSTYTFYNIPTRARILGASRAYWDDLASTGAPTLDFGLYAVKGNFTSDQDALNDGLDAATVNNTGVPVIKDKANYGKQAWEFVAGLTTDPGGFAAFTVSLLDADVNVGGTVTVELFYMVD